MFLLQLRFFHLSILLIIFLITFLPAYSQRGSDTTLVTKNITAVSANYLGLAISQERSIGERVTLFFGAGAHYSFYGTSYPTLGTRFINVIEKRFGRDYSTTGTTPYIFLEARIYTNLLKRQERNKNIKNNAGSYLALFGEVPFASGNLINVSNLELGYPLGLKFGLRRNLSNHFYLDGSVAIVNLISDRQRSTSPRLDIAVFWAF
jgi:hypothetical protein